VTLCRPRAGPNLLHSEGCHNSTLNQGGSVGANNPKNDDAHNHNLSHCSLLGPPPPGGGRGEWAHPNNLRVCYNEGCLHLHTLILTI